MKTILNPDQQAGHHAQGSIATYRESPVPAYRGNPLIEALPPIMTEDETMMSLGHFPPHTDEDRAAPASVRLHMVTTALNFFQPLPQHLDLERRVSGLLRSGYVGRNPLQRGHWQLLNQQVHQLRAGLRASPITHAGDPKGILFFGISGIGKTATLREIMSGYPHVIYHNRYGRQNFTMSQIVHLTLPCPFDGSIRGLCINFFQTVDDLLGTNYYDSYARSRSTTDEMLPRLARVASLHALGVLVIDEIQHLNQAASGGAAKMLNFFVQLVNTISVPTIMVGTYAAMAVLSREFRQIRRGCGFGDVTWDRMSNDTTWALFCESLWRYQYTGEVTPLTPELRDTHYDLCQGITDFAVKIYLLAQFRSITTDDKAVSSDRLREVAHDSLRSAQPALAALRAGDTRRLALYSDLLPIDFQSAAHALQTVPPPSPRPLPAPAAKLPAATTHAAAPVPPAMAVAVPQKPRRKRRSRSKTKPPAQPGSLMEIAAQSIADGKTPDSAFRELNLIRSGTDLSRQEPSHAGQLP